MTRVAAGTEDWADDLNTDLDGIEAKADTSLSTANEALAKANQVPSLITVSGAEVTAGPVPNFQSATAYASVGGNYLFKTAMRITKAIVQCAAAGVYAIEIDSEIVWTGTLPNTGTSDVQVTLPIAYDVTPGMHYVRWLFLGGGNTTPIRGMDSRSDTQYIEVKADQNYKTSTGSAPAGASYAAAIRFIGPIGTWRKASS